LPGGVAFSDSAISVPAVARSPANALTKALSQIWSEKSVDVFRGKALFRNFVKISRAADATSLDTEDKSVPRKSVENCRTRRLRTEAEPYLFAEYLSEIVGLRVTIRSFPPNFANHFFQRLARRQSEPPR